MKLYLAILNSGWIRREMAYTVIPRILQTPNVDVLWENPALSWGHPISSNRNAITQRFLATDCEFLLMIDDDVVPFHNPAEIVFADRDIVGCPTKVRQVNRSCNWNLYQYIGDGYLPVDLRRAPSDGDIVPVDIVGSGCIMVKRLVLESIKAAWNCEYDEHGVTTYGTDFAFCRRAKKAGFEVWATPWRWCEHFKDGVGLSDYAGYDHVDQMCTDNAKYEIPWGGYAIQEIDWQFLRPLVTGKRVLEFGSGLSTLLISEVAESIDSYEKDPDTISMLQAKGTKARAHRWNGDGLPELLESYDIAFVDGPRGGENRRESIMVAASRANRVVVHDAGRCPELRWQREILAKDFQQVAWNGSHQQRCALWVRKGA